MPRTKKTISKKDDDLGKQYFDILAPGEEEIKEEETKKEEKVEKIKEEEEGILSIRKETFTQIVKNDEITEIEEVEEIKNEEETYEKADEELEPVTYRERFEAKEEPISEIEEIEEIYEEVRPKRKITFKMKSRVFAVSIICLVLVGVGMGLYTFAFNKANVVVKTRKSTIKYEGIILADTTAKDIDANKGIIPGKLVTVSKTLEKEFPATGKVSGGSKAHGKILIYNAYSQTPQVLVTGTRFESTDGLIFKLNARTVVPGATLKNGDLTPVSIEAEVTAAENGTTYNIAAGRFMIPGFKGGDKYNGFYGETKVAMTGGSEGESIVVSSGDLKAAENTIGDELFKVLSAELEKQISKDERTFKEAVVTRVIKFTPGASVGDSMTKFKVSIQGEVKTISVAKKDLDNLVKTNLSPSLTSVDQLYGNPEYIFSNLKFNAEKGNISFYTTCSYPAKKVLNKEEILGLIKGKSVEEVKKALLNNDKIESAQIKLSPFWLNGIPVEKEKIALTID